MAWASEQTWGGCSHRAAIYAIANHANDQWFCWAKQSTLAAESEQSPDSVGRRIADFVACGRVRRIKLKRHGRRTHDFLILQPSVHFDAPIEVIEQFIPRGCEIMADDDAAAGCGSVEAKESAAAPEDSQSHAAADCGSVENPTLPQPAVHAAALVRQPIEPFSEPEDSPHAPQGGQAGSDTEREEKQVDGWPEFKSAFEGDSVPITRPSIALREFEGLSRDDRKLATIAARGLIAHRKRERRPSGKPSAQTFIRERDAWPGWAKLAPPEPVPLVFIEAESGDDAALRCLSRIAGFAEPMAAVDAKTGKRGYWRRSAVPPDLHALIDVPSDEGAWLIVADKTPEFYAWAARIKEWSGARVEAKVILLDEMSTIKTLNGEITARKRIVGLRVPWRWPPRKDGSHAPPGESSAA